MSTKPTNYNKEDLSNTQNGDLVKIVHVDDKKQTISMDMTLYQVWTDPRITSAWKDVGLSQQDLEKIWKPDLMIHGIKEMKIHQSFEPHLGAWLATEENVIWVQLVSIFDFTVSCKMR